MNSTAEDKARTISENVWMVLVARLAMVLTPVATTALVWLATSWLDQKMESVIRPLAEVRERVIILETKIQADELKSAQQDIYVQLTKDALAKISTATDSITSKVGQISSDVSVMAERINKLGK